MILCPLCSKSFPQKDIEVKNYIIYNNLLTKFVGILVTFSRIMRQRVVKTLFLNRLANSRGSPAKCVKLSCFSTPSMNCTCAPALQNRKCPELSTSESIRFPSGQCRGRGKLSLVPYLLVFQPKIKRRM